MESANINTYIIILYRKIRKKSIAVPIFWRRIAENRNELSQKMRKNCTVAVDKRVRHVYNILCASRLPRVYMRNLTGRTSTCQDGYRTVEQRIHTAENDMEPKREIDYTKKLPDAEFDVMLAIWEAEPPVNTAYLMEKVGRGRG